MTAVSFTVDYGKKVNEALDAAAIGWRATARLGVFGSGTHTLSGERVRFDEELATPAVLERIKARGLRPATLFELVSAAHADAALGADGVVVALGSCDVNFAGGSASPAISSFGGERQVVMMGFLGVWPARTEFLAIPTDAPAGLGSVSHNHLLPIEAKRSPKLVFAQPPCALTARVRVDGAGSVQDAVKAGKLRNVNTEVHDAALFPPDPAVRQLEITAVTFNRQLRSVEAMAELAARGLRPARLRELLAFVIAMPDTIDNRSIWALGDARPVGAYKAGTRTLGVHHGINTAADSTERWEPWAWFVGVRELDGSAAVEATKKPAANAKKRIQR